MSRLREEIPDSIRFLTDALLNKQVEELDMSDNAFGPDGIKGWENFVRNCSAHLTTLKINNCGLSPLGGEMIAAALKANENLKLQHFEAGRDRLENDGISALASFFKKSATLQVISVPQNGIKVEGMTALMDSLITNKGLRELRVNDNWLKGDAVEAFIVAIPVLENLEVLDISDCDIGSENVRRIAQALKKAKSLRVLLCNYNEADEAEDQYKILESLLHITTLKEVEFRGNTVSKQLENAVRAKFEEQGKKIEFKDIMADEDDEEEEEEEDEDAKEMAERFTALQL